MLILVARYRNREELEARYLADFDNGGLFYPTRKNVAVGASVVVDIRMPQLGDHLLIRGVVASSGKLPHHSRSGVKIEFLPQEKGKNEHLLQILGGEEIPSAQRKHRRIPSNMSVEWRVPNEPEQHTSLAGDIGQGGMFIQTERVKPIGTQVLVELTPPGGTSPQTLEARVAWISPSTDCPGIGVQFKCRDVIGKRRIRELVKRIREAAN